MEQKRLTGKVTKCENVDLAIFTAIAHFLVGDLGTAKKMVYFKVLG
jgi:hypothetical protein